MAGSDGVAAQLLRVAEAIEAGRSDAAILQALQQAGASRPANGRQSADELHRLGTGLETWRQVWPRMGGQRDFRMAVAREARLWAKRLA